MDNSKLAPLAPLTYPPVLAPVQRKIILLAGPGPRRDVLLAVLRSMPRPGAILYFNTLLESEAHLKTAEALVVIVDHMPDDQSLKPTIACIRQWNREAAILLLVGNPREIFQDNLHRPDAVLCNGFSLASLAQEVERLQS
jgi:hypothetical protein